MIASHNVFSRVTTPEWLGMIALVKTSLGRSLPRTLLTSGTRTPQSLIAALSERAPPPHGSISRLRGGKLEARRQTGQRED
jgi:hypothetical protein